jgi:hypothetical protein
MQETKEEYEARIAERKRVDEFISKKLAERRAYFDNVNKPLTTQELAMHKANEVRTWFTPPAMQALAHLLGAQPIADQPTPDQKKVLQNPQTKQLQQQTQGSGLIPPQPQQQQAAPGG